MYLSTVSEGKGIINIQPLLTVMLVSKHIDYFFTGFLWKPIVLAKSIDFTNIVEALYYIITIVFIFVWNTSKNRYLLNIQRILLHDQ